MNLPQIHRSISLRFALAFALLALPFSGCKSRQEKEIDQAKEQAAKTGQPQQVVSTDSNGNTVTTVVQPPAPGQTGQTITTTVAPAASGQNALSANSGQSGQSGPGGQPAAQAQQAPPPPPIEIAAGTNLTIRIDHSISVKTARDGDGFTGEIVEPFKDSSGNPVIPKGSSVEGVVEHAHKRGHFKGASDLELRLTSLTLNGNRYPINTADVDRHKKGKGKRSFGMIGGGAGAGMLIGGLATGGTGLVVGGLLGAGAGTAGAGLTGNHDLVIPAESIVHFTLAEDLSLQH
jgi:hypothetical protein